MVSFRLKRATSPRTAIQAIVCIDYWQTAFGIGVSIAPKDWDKNNQRAKKNTAIAGTVNPAIAKARTDIEKVIAKLTANGVPVTPEALRKNWEEVRGKAQQSKAPELFEAFDEFIEESKATVRPATIKIYTTVRNHLQGFCKAHGVKLTFDKFDAVYADKIVSYLLNVKQLANNSIGNQVKNWKVFLQWSHKKGYHSNDAYKEFKAKRFEYTPQIITLTEDELQLIRGVELPDGRLSRVRDCFLVQVGTGVRYSDLAAIRPEHIKGNSLRIITQKTDDAVTIPILPEVRAILERWEYRLPVISNQQYNAALKDLAKDAEVDTPTETVSYAGTKRTNLTRPKWELITTHVARKSFITLSLARGMRPEVLMKISGHSDWSSFKRYVGVSDEIASRELQAAWNDEPAVSNLAMRMQDEGITSMALGLTTED